MAATGDTMWNGRYGEEETKRRAEYARRAPFREQALHEAGVKPDPISRAQYGSKWFEEK